MLVRPSFFRERLPTMSPDPLSDVLSLLRPRSYVAGGFDLGGRWSIQFEKHGGVKYFALVSGAAWLEVERGGPPLRLEAGDCILLPNGRRFVIAKNLAFRTVPLLAAATGTCSVTARSKPRWVCWSISLPL